MSVARLLCATLVKQSLYYYYLLLPVGLPSVTVAFSSSSSFSTRTSATTCSPPTSLAAFWGYYIHTPAACLLKPVSQLTPIVVDRLQYELRNNIVTRTKLPTSSRVSATAFNHNVSLKPASGNMASTLANPQVIDEYLRTEVQSGRVAGPFLQPPFHNLHVSRFGAIPRRIQPGK